MKARANATPKAAESDRPEGGEARLDQTGDRRLGDEAENEGGDRDAELRTRQHEAQSLVDRHGAARLAVVLGGLGELPAPSGHEGELTGDEISVGHDQRDDREDSERIQHGVNFEVGRRTWPPR